MKLLLGCPGMREAESARSGILKARTVRGVRIEEFLVSPSHASLNRPKPQVHNPKHFVTPALPSETLNTRSPQRALGFPEPRLTPVAGLRRGLGRGASRGRGRLVIFSGLRFHNVE